MDLIRALLSWIARPWQALFIVIAVPLGLIAVVVWEMRGALESVIAHQLGAITLNTDAFRLEADRLLGQGVTAVVLYSVEIATNDQRHVETRAVAGLNLNGLAGIHVPFIAPSGTSAPLTADALLLGRQLCWAPAEGVSAHSLIYAAAGIGYVCSTPVPLTPGVVVGVLHVGWPMRPPVALEQSVLAGARAASSRLVRW